MNSTSNFKHDNFFNINTRKYIQNFLSFIKKTSILPLLVDGKLNTIFEKH